MTTTPRLDASAALRAAKAAIVALGHDLTDIHHDAVVAVASAIAERGELEAGTVGLILSERDPRLKAIRARMRGYK